MMFWIWALVILLLSGFLSLWPLLGRGSSWKLAASGGVLVLPVAGYFIYQGVGTPQALEPTAVQALAPLGADMDTLTEQLRNRLTEDPEQVEGWLLLGRSYKQLQKYPQALEAFETANQLVPDQPIIMVELVEAQLFNSADPRFTTDMIANLEKAVAAEPELQKGLWLLGMAAFQSGDDALAVTWWEALLRQIEPGSPIEQSVKQQVNEARTRQGLDSASDAPDSINPDSVPDLAWQGADIVVELSAVASESWPDIPSGEVPAGAALFIIARPEGSNTGPPLGARRVVQPRFPLQVRLTDEDSMLPQRPISSAERLELRVRLSLSGQAAPSPGDWEGSTPVIYNGSGELTQLILDQKLN